MFKVGVMIVSLRHGEALVANKAENKTNEECFKCPDNFSKVSVYNIFVLFFVRKSCQK